MSVESKDGESCLPGAVLGSQKFVLCKPALQSSLWLFP